MGLFGKIFDDVLGIWEPPPGPDPRIGDAAVANTQISQGYLDLANKTYDDQKAIFDKFAPLLEESLGLGIEEAKKYIERSDAQWESYLETWKPVEDELAKRSLEMADPARIEAEAARAGSETTTQYDRARQETRRSLEMAGASPEKIAALEASGRLTEAKAVAGNSSAARREGESKAMAYLDNASRFGRNMPSTGIAAAATADQLSRSSSGQMTNLVNAAGMPAQTAGSLYGGAVSANNSAIRGYGLLWEQGSAYSRSLNDFTSDVINAGASYAGGR